MASTSIFRLAARVPTSTIFRPAVRQFRRAPILASQIQSGCAKSAFSTSLRRSSGGHEEETFEEFSARYANHSATLELRETHNPTLIVLASQGGSRYEKEFDSVQDVFELQRNLNNAFAYDLVPSPAVCIAALKAARRVNDYPTAVRVFEGIKAKVENTHQYDEYLEELKPLREEMGINLKEELYPEGTDSPYFNQ